MHRKAFIDVLIRTVYITGMTGVVIVAPNALQAMEYFVQMNDKKRARNYASFAKRSGYFDVYDHRDGSYAIRLSKKGQQRGRVIRLDSFTFEAPNKWDGKWHMFMFDIPERHAAIRRFISQRVREIGLYKFQDSIYVYPFSLDDFMRSLYDCFPEVQPYCNVAVIEYTDAEHQLRKKFRRLIEPKNNI